MTTILKDNELTHKMDNILLWLDNEEYLYNKLQRINKECIFKYQYYNTWYIKDTYRQQIKSHIWKYRDLINDVIDFTSDNENLKLNAKQLFQLARHLYLREIENVAFNFNTGLEATNTIKSIMENK